MKKKSLELYIVEMTCPSLVMAFNKKDAVNKFAERVIEDLQSKTFPLRVYPVKAISTVLTPTIHIPGK